VHNAAQTAKANKLKIDSAQYEFDETKQIANTRFLAGSASVIDRIGQENPELVVPAVLEISEEMIRRGIMDPAKFDPELVKSTPVDQLLAKNKETLATSFATLGGRPLVPKSELMSDRSTSAERNFAMRQQLVQQYGEGSQQVANFDEMVRAGSIQDIAGVPTRVSPFVGTGGAPPTTPLSTQQEELDYAQREAEAKEMGSRAGRPTQAQETIDTEFAKEYAQLTVGGGLTDAQKAISQLDQVYRDLQDPSKNLSGLAVVMQPRFVLAQTNPEALDTREQVEEIVQRNLRLILGAQFTEREGVRLIERAYNPALDESYNMIRVGRLFDQIRTAAKMKLEMVRYYEQNGTLAGFNISAIPEMRDFYNALQFQRGDVVDGYEFLGGDATVKENWRKVQ
jgi:hypothetical protein